MTKEKKDLLDELNALRRRLSKIEQEDGSSLLTGEDKEIKMIYNKIEGIVKILKAYDDEK